MLDDPRQKKDPSSTVYYLWEFGYRALKHEHWSFRRCQLAYPHLCAEASLVASMRTGKGQYYAVFTWGGLGPVIATEDKKEGFTFYTSEGVGMQRADSDYDYDVAEDARGDVLLARWYPRTLPGEKTKKIVTEHLYVRGHRLKLLKRVTEEFPIEPE